MKKVLLSLFTVLLAASALFAQTPEEILARMDEETKRFEQEGVYMVMEFKIPILGSFASNIYMLGNKYKAVTDVRGDITIDWSDDITDWEYDSSKNQITIKNAKPSEQSRAESNMQTLSGVTDGYDVKLKKEDAQAWYFRCTKLKTNTKKDDPKSMDLVISKSTYLPISHKASMKGVTVTLRDFAIGVKEEDVTFNAADYPNVSIVDER